MKKSLNGLLVVVLAAGLVTNSALGFEAYFDEEEKPKVIPFLDWEVNSKYIIIGAEGVGAGAGGAALGAAACLLTSYLVWHASERPDPAAELPFYAGFAVGCGLAAPLGSALGASGVGGFVGERGSFWRSWAGAELGALAALCLTLPADWSEPSIPLLVLGPLAGAVIGYNLDSPRKRSSSTGGSLNESLRGSGSELSLFVPEVEVRQDRVANTFWPRLRRDPTLAYKVTIARLSF